MWRGRSHGSGVGYRIFIEVMHRLGLHAAYGLLWLVVPFYVLFGKKTRRALGYYYRGRWGLRGWALRRAIWKHVMGFGRSLVDRVAMRSGMAEKFDYTFDNYEEFLEAADREKGIVLIGAHVGSWEAGVSFFKRLQNRIYVVKVEEERTSVRRELNKVYTEGGYRELLLTREGNLEGVVALKHALDHGGVVCFMGDRYLEGQPTITHSFLGKEARFPAGPWSVAQRLHCEVWYYFSLRTGKRSYRFFFVKGGGHATLKEDVAHYVTCLDRVVKQYPEQWYNFYDYWQESTQ